MIFQDFNKVANSGAPDFLSEKGQQFLVEFICPTCGGLQQCPVLLYGKKVFVEQNISCPGCKATFPLKKVTTKIQRFFRKIKIENQESVSPHTIFIDAVSAASALVISADEVVKREEIREFRDFIDKLFGDKDSLEYARVRLNFFLDNRDKARGAYSKLSLIDDKVRLAVIELLFFIAYSDGELDPREEKMISEIAGHLKITQDKLSEIRGQFSDPGASDYSLLGIPETSDFNLVKEAYRKKALEFHPDKYQNLPLSFQDFAKKQFQIVQAAYERLRRKFENV